MSIYTKTKLPADTDVNIGMQYDVLIEQGNQSRSERQYETALSCYARAFTENRHGSAAFNNYGNVLREIGEPEAALPFLERAVQLNPQDPTSQFNRAVCLLLMGNYQSGWPAYETRWNYEHLAGTLPQFPQPRWQGQELANKDILVVGEQGHGDCIQFSRFVHELHQRGARVHLQVTDALVPLFQNSAILASVTGYDAIPSHIDYWVPIMSLPAVLGVTLENLARPTNYVTAPDHLVSQWRERLGAKTRLRVGIGWSGRRDAWLNQHKSVPFPVILDLVNRHPEIEWCNLQIDATPEESLALTLAGVRLFPGAIGGFHDSAALISNLDLVIGVDTATSHLSAALGRPTWIMLQRFAQCWRWLLHRSDSPWYTTARLFRQKDFDEWHSVIQDMEKFITWFKV